MSTVKVLRCKLLGLDVHLDACLRCKTTAVLKHLSLMCEDCLVKIDSLDRAEADFTRFFIGVSFMTLMFANATIEQLGFRHYTIEVNLSESEKLVAEIARATMLDLGWEVSMQKNQGIDLYSFTR